MDYGKDFYAAVTWNDVPDGRRIAIGWMSNWNYAGAIPTSPWRSAMSVPARARAAHDRRPHRSSSSSPVRELRSLRGWRSYRRHQRRIPEGTTDAARARQGARDRGRRCGSATPSGPA